MSDLCLCHTSVCLSFPLFPLCTGCQQQGTQLLHRGQAPQNPQPAPPSAPGARPAASGEQGWLCPSVPPLPGCRPEANPQENPIYPQVSSGQSRSISAAPNTSWCCSCQGVGLWLGLKLPADPRGEIGMFWSVSAPCLLVRHMQYIGIIFLFICMIFLLIFMGFTEMKSFKLAFFKLLFRRYHVS